MLPQADLTLFEMSSFKQTVAGIGNRHQRLRSPGGCGRRNQCSSMIVGSIIRRCASRHLLQVAARGGPGPVVRSMGGLRPLGTRAPG